MDINNDNNQTSNSFEVNEPKKKSRLKITIITTISIVVIAIVLRLGLMLSAAHKLDVSVGKLHKTETELHEILGVSRVGMIKVEYLITIGDKEGLADELISYIPVALIDSLGGSDVESDVNDSSESEA